ncbi:MAG: hypothetical protein AAF399_10005 [Bacteroidota bacterium]
MPLLTSTHFRQLSLLLCGWLISFSLQGAEVQLSFFCELPGNEFLLLAEDSSLVADLQEMGAEIRLGLTDLSEARALGVQRFNQAGIPVVAWLLLSKQEGYFFHVGNPNEAANRYQAFQQWSQQYELEWAGLGLDFEPSMEDIRLGVQHPFRLFGQAYRRLYDEQSLAESEQAYQELVANMAADGYEIEIYVLPLIYDERAAGTKSFQRLTGILDLQGLREIPMCYTSGPGINPAAILNYGREGNAVALGSTGGGIEVEGISLPPMSWEELSRDLLLAHQVSSEIHIFSLEGCLAQGYFSRLQTFSFQQTVELYSGEMQDQSGTRGQIQTALLLLHRPLLSTLGLLCCGVLLFWMVIRLIRTFRNRSS